MRTLHHNDGPFLICSTDERARSRSEGEHCVKLRSGEEGVGESAEREGGEGGQRKGGNRWTENMSKQECAGKKMRRTRGPLQ